MDQSSQRPLFEFRKNLFIYTTELMAVRGSTPPLMFKETAAETTRAPSFEVARVISLLSKRGAEGQSRTDTGSPLPVFECGASYIS